MQEHLGQFANGAALAVGQDLTDKVLKSNQCQQGLQIAANGIVQSGVAVVSTLVAAGHTATVVGTVIATGTTMALAAAAPVAAVGVAGYGVYKFCKWLMA